MPLTPGRFPERTVSSMSRRLQTQRRGLSRATQRHRNLEHRSAASCSPRRPYRSALRASCQARRRRPGWGHPTRDRRPRSPP
eukprot:2913473-Pyramimonas_sp.AAC.1